MKITKMQGLGNDYLYVFGTVPENIEELCIKLSDRHFGLGSDGMIFILPSDTADFKMRIFNSDGSEAKMCGNGIRCVGKYVFDKGYTDKTDITVETLSGIKKLKLFTRDGKVESACVDMGKAVVTDKKSIVIENMEFELVCVDVGNPHAVTFVNDIDSLDVAFYGSKIEKSELFPGGVNAEFIQVIDKNTLRMRVWERGSGITLACGTGACASVRAAVSEGCCNYNEKIKVVLDGGTLEIEINGDETVIMNGPAATVFETEMDL